MFLGLSLIDRSSAEGGLSLICTCIPAVNKLFTELSRKRTERTEEKQRRNELVRLGPRSSAREGASLFSDSLPTLPALPREEP